MKCSRRDSRYKRKVRIKKKISGTVERPRLSVFRSAKHIYAQIVDDISGKTLASASTVDKSLKVETGDDESKIGIKTLQAHAVGKYLAEKALEKDIKKVVFDRNGFIYHGRVKAVSDGARKAGLDF